MEKKDQNCNCLSGQFFNTNTPKTCPEGTFVFNLGSHCCSVNKDKSTAGNRLTYYSNTCKGEQTDCPYGEYQCTDNNFPPADLVDLGDDYCTEATPCNHCEGHCDDNKGCAEGLLCFKRNFSSIIVPGCGSGGSGDDPTHDYCYDPTRAEPKKPFITNGTLKEGENVCTETSQCNHCEGNCDNDEGCAPGLLCYKRDSAK